MALCIVIITNFIEALFSSGLPGMVLVAANVISPNKVHLLAY
jgi:hypothetical protein